MAETGIRIEGLPPLRKVLKEVGSLKPVKDGLRAGAVHLKRKIDVYPKQRDPVNSKWRYKRGEGSIYVPTGKLYPTSEVHSKSWGAESSHGGLTWTLGSDTSYGPFLQDKDKQTLYHKTTGWKTTQDVTEQESDDVMRKVKREIDRALARAR